MFLCDIGTERDTRPPQPFVLPPPPVPQRTNWVGVALFASVSWPFLLAAMVCMLPVLALSSIVGVFQKASESRAAEAWAAAYHLRHGGNVAAAMAGINGVPPSGSLRG